MIDAELWFAPSDDKEQIGYISWEYREVVGHKDIRLCRECIHIHSSAIITVDDDKKFIITNRKHLMDFYKFLTDLDFESLSKQFDIDLKVHSVDGDFD